MKNHSNNNDKYKKKSNNRNYSKNSNHSKKNNRLTFNSPDINDDNNLNKRDK